MDPNAAICFWRDLDSQPVKGGDLWATANKPDGDPKVEKIQEKFCSTPALGAGAAGVVDWRVVPIATLTPPDPQDIYLQVKASMKIPEPHLQFGPDPAELAVKIPVWIWVDNAADITAHNTDLTLRIDVTATLSHLRMTMGEPATTSNSYTPGNPATIDCTTAGTAPIPGTYDRKTPPPCGYTYHWKSTPERTRGSGTWTVTTTATWAVRWQSTTGRRGTDTIQRTSTTNIHIGEFRSSLVRGPTR